MGPDHRTTAGLSAQEIAGLAQQFRAAFIAVLSQPDPQVRVIFI
jgi:hypothetical protein